MKNPLFCEPARGRAAFALLALRLVAGPAFILHGWGKIQHAFSWMGPTAPVPSWLQGLAAFAEFGGGFAVLFGLLTQLAALGIACVMLTAMFMHHIPHGDPFVAMKGGPSWEPAADYLAMMVALILRGAGSISLDAVICGKKKD